MTRRLAVLPLWHYTTGEHLTEIMRDGCLRPTAILIDPGEHPAVWFSALQDWEPTASKLLVDTETDEVRRATMQEMRKLAGGPVRIGVAHDAAPIDWETFKRTSGISRKSARALEIAAADIGSNPRLWFASFDPVPRERWLALEARNGPRWEPISPVQ
jgi:hypothetical protein